MVLTNLWRQAERPAERGRLLAEEHEWRCPAAIRLARRRTERGTAAERAPSRAVADDAAETRMIYCEC